MDMGSKGSPNCLDDEVFVGPVTQRELIITWRRRRQERLKREHAETLMNVEDGTQPSRVGSGEPDLKKSHMPTEEHDLSATIGGQSSKNTTDASGTANIDSDDQLQDMIFVGKKEEDGSEVFRNDEVRFANEHKEAPIVGNVSANGNAIEIQDESLSTLMIPPNPKTEESVCLIPKVEDVLDEVGQSNPSGSNTWCTAPPSAEDVPIVDKSRGIQESDLNVSSQEDNHESLITVEESTRNRPVAEPVETPSKETSFCSADQSINEMSGEMNESVREPIAEKQLSLEPEAHQSGNLQDAADEKDADEKFVDESTCYQHFTQPVETQLKETSFCSANLSINELSGENNESVNQLDESTCCLPIAEPVETQSKETNFCSADQSINVVSGETNESVREPIAEQQNLQAAADEKDAVEQTGYCEKSVDGSTCCQSIAEPFETQLKETSFCSANLSINELSGENNESVKQLDESTCCQPIAEHVETQSKKTSVCSADQSINERMRESIAEQKVSSESEAHQSGNLQAAAEDKDAVDLTGIFEKSVDESTCCQPIAEPHLETQSKETSFYSADQSINEMSGETNEIVREPIAEQQLSLEPEALLSGNLQTAADGHTGNWEKSVDGSPRNQPIAEPVGTQSKETSFCSANLSINELSGENNESVSQLDESTCCLPIAEPVETLSKETSFRSADQSINETRSEINGSVREPIVQQQLSLEPEAHQSRNLQAAADEEDTVNQTGNREKSVGESTCCQPIAEPVETQSKETSFYCADQSINEMSGETNEIVREPIAEQLLSLEPEALLSGNLQAAADEKDAVDQTGFCEKTVDESPRNQPIAEPVETLSMETSFYSLDQSINEMSGETNEILREPIAELPLSLETKAHQSGNLQAAADEKDADGQTGNWEKSVDGNQQSDCPSETNEVLIDLEQEENKENGPVDSNPIIAKDRFTTDPAVSGALTHSETLHSGILYSIEPVPKSNIPKPSIIKPATLNVDQSTLNTSWVKRINCSKIPKPKRPFYVQPLDKQ